MSAFVGKGVLLRAVTESRGSHRHRSQGVRIPEVVVLLQNQLDLLLERDQPNIAPVEPMVSPGINPNVVNRMTLSSGCTWRGSQR